MADVNGQFYTGRKLRQGVSASSPSNETGVTPTPVNPPGSGGVNLFTQLGDVNDSNYIGKNGFVPVVVDEQYLQLQPLPQTEQNGLISGGIVQWTGTGYVFNISSAYYRITGDLYNSAATQLTLSTPDPTNDRIDVFAVDVNGAVVVIEGTPAATPVQPQVDPSTQLELTSVIVTAASTTPTLTEEVVYDENTEWTGTSSGTGTANFASTNDPYQGTVSIETTNIQNGFQVVLDNGVDFDLTGYLTFGFQIKLKASLGGNQNIGLTFLDSADVAISNIYILPLNKSDLTYQFIGITLSTLNLNSLDVRKIRFSYIRTGGSPTFSGYFLDIVKLEGGINPPITVGSFLGLTDTPSTYSGQGGKTVSVKADETGLEFVTAGGGGLTGSGTANEIAYFTGATALASLTTGTYPSLTELSYVKGVTSGIQAQLNAKPTTFIGLTDTPANYTGSANKWARVNGTPDALIFDTVSPYDLDQEGATDGQVLAWSTANSRYEPITGGGGGGADVDAVHYNAADGKTASEKQQARDNIGSNAGIPDIITTTGVINSYVRTSNILIFTGAGNVDLRGISAGQNGEKCTIINLMSAFTVYIRVVSTVGFGVNDSITLGYKQVANLRYSTAISRWILENDFKENYTIITPGSINMPGNASLNATAKIALRATASTTARIYSLVFGNNSALVGGIMGGGNITGPRSVESVDHVRRDEKNLYDELGSSDTGTINDFSLSVKFSMIRFTGATGLTGVTEGENGREIVILNDKGSNLTLFNEDAGSIAANRFSLGGANFDILPNQYKKLIYYGSRWRIQS